MWLIDPEVAVTIREYCPAGVPGSGLLEDELLPPPQPDIQNMEQTQAQRIPKYVALRRLAKKNMRANASEPEPNGRSKLPGKSLLACAAVVETVRVTVPLFKMDAGLTAQVDSLGLPEHDSVMVPLKLPNWAIVKANVPVEPLVIVKLAELEPVPISKSGALMFNERFEEVADAQLLSPEYRKFIM